MTMSCRAGGRVSSHRKSVRPAAEQAAAMITAVKVAVQARSEGFLVLHHVLGLAAARSEYNAGARQDGAPSPGVTPWIKFVAGACQPLPLCTERHLRSGQRPGTAPAAAGPARRRRVAPRGLLMNPSIKHMWSLPGSRPAAVAPIGPRRVLFARCSRRVGRGSKPWH